MHSQVHKCSHYRQIYMEKKRHKVSAEHSPASWPLTELGTRWQGVIASAWVSGSSKQSNQLSSLHNVFDISYLLFHHFRFDSADLRGLAALPDLAAFSLSTITYMSAISTQHHDVINVNLNILSPDSSPFAYLQLSNLHCVYPTTKRLYLRWVFHEPIQAFWSFIQNPCWR